VFSNTKDVKASRSNLNASHYSNEIASLAKNINNQSLLLCSQKSSGNLHKLLPGLPLISVVDVSSIAEIVI
jgi:hypothetical protein